MTKAETKELNKIKEKLENLSQDIDSIITDLTARRDEAEKLYNDLFAFTYDKD